MTRSPETKRRQLAQRLAERAERGKLAAASAAVDLHVATLQARAASPRNPLADRAAQWNNYMHLPTVWADLARKQLYEVTADEMAALLAATIRAATSAGTVDRFGRVVTADSVFVIVARKALPFAAEFHAAWLDYWRQQS